MKDQGHGGNLTTGAEESVGPRQFEGVPVRELLDLPALAEARVVAGGAGLERSVTSVNVMEVPDIVAWVRAGELLLTTTYPLRDDRAELAELVPRLVERGLSALAIKPARYIDTIPEPMIAAADQLAIPLLELSAQTSFNDVMNAVLTVILNRQAARLQRTAEIHDRFTRIVLGGGGSRQIAQALAESIRRPVFVLDPHGTLLGRSVAPGVPIPAWPLDPKSDDVEPTPGQTVQPIRVGGELYGAIVVLGDESELGGDERDALEYAATVAALRQVQARAVADADRRYEAVCLEELVAGQVSDRDVLMERAAAFGWDLSVPRSVVLVTIDAAAPGSMVDQRSARHAIADAARGAFGRSSIVWERGDGVGTLAAGPVSSVSVAARELHAEASRRLPGGVVLSVGAGRPVDNPLELARSAAEARAALRVGRWRKEAGGVAVFADLGLDRLLLTAPAAERRSLVETALGALLEREPDGGILLDTLEAFLDRRNTAQAARDLFVHYNTLANRLDRIEELIGPFRDDPERCLALGLALRLRRLPA